jgi:hypothetical protein
LQYNIESKTQFSTFARKLRLSEKSIFHIDDNSIVATQPHKDWDTYRL